MRKPNYTKEDVLKVFQEIGLQHGQNVFVHANIGFLGTLAGALSADDYCQTLIDCFEEVIGPEGTLVMPTFSYSFCNGEVFDPLQTKSTCGLLADWFWQKGKAQRSLEANFSVAAKGPLASYLVRDQPQNPFSEQGVFARFFQKQGVYCNINFDSAGTILHYFERELKVPYRYDKTFAGQMLLESLLVPTQFDHFVAAMNKPEDTADFRRFHQTCVDQQRAKVMSLGKGSVTFIHTKDMFDVVREGLQQDPGFLRLGPIQ